MPMKTRQMWWCFFHSMHSLPLFNTDTYRDTQQHVMWLPPPNTSWFISCCSKYKDFHSCPLLCQCTHYQLQQTIVHTRTCTHPVSIYHFNFYEHLGTFHISSSDSVVIFILFCLLFPHASMLSLMGVATHGSKVLWKLYPNMLCMTVGS